MMFILLYIKFLSTHIHSAVLDSLRECTVQALGTGLPLAPTYVYEVAWLHYAGTVPSKMYEQIF